MVRHEVALFCVFSILCEYLVCLYAGVLAARCAFGAKSRGQCTKSGLNGDRRTPENLPPLRDRGGRYGEINWIFVLRLPWQSESIV